MTTHLIVGARFRPPAEDVLLNLPAGADLLLRRQPDNPHDENAIQVMVDFRDKDGSPTKEYKAVENVLTEYCERTATELDAWECLHLGFIPREHAKRLAPLMDAHSDPETFIVRDLPGKLTFGPSGGPMVQFEEPSAQEPKP